MVVYDHGFALIRSLATSRIHRKTGLTSNRYNDLDIIFFNGVKFAVILPNVNELTQPHKRVIHNEQ